MKTFITRWWQYENIHNKIFSHKKDKDCVTQWVVKVRFLLFYSAGETAQGLPCAPLNMYHGTVPAVHFVCVSVWQCVPVISGLPRLRQDSLGSVATSYFKNSNQNTGLHLFYN